VSARPAVRLVRDLAEWRAVRATLAAEGRTVGFAPTMGALHAGHAALFRRSAAENDVTVASVFVNPTQFNDAGDLAAYPRTLDADAALMTAAGVDICLVPGEAAIYPDGYRFRVTERGRSEAMEGRYRPGHFDGVLTVVLRLLLLVRPHRAYFGEKDWQQYRLVHDLAEAFHLGVAVVGCPTVREPDGLALSSRNVRLGPAARELAGRFARRLAGPGPVDEVRRDLEALGIEVQYVEEDDGRRLAAVVIAGVRLIDNVPLPE
jgi:pantoate--beta-alanine ligase